MVSGRTHTCQQDKLCRERTRNSALKSSQQQQLWTMHCIHLQCLGVQAKAAHVGLSRLQEDGFLLLCNTYFTMLDSLQTLCHGCLICSSQDKNPGERSRWNRALPVLAVLYNLYQRVCCLKSSFPALVQLFISSTFLSLIVLANYTEYTTKKKIYIYQDQIRSREPINIACMYPQSKMKVVFSRQRLTMLFFFCTNLISFTECSEKCY